MYYFFFPVEQRRYYKEHWGPNNIDFHCINVLFFFYMSSFCSAEERETHRVWNDIRVSK